MYIPYYFYQLHLTLSTHCHLHCIIPEYDGLLIQQDPYDLLASNHLSSAVMYTQSTGF